MPCDEVVSRGKPLNYLVLPLAANVNGKEQEKQAVDMKFLFLDVPCPFSLFSFFFLCPVC